MTIILFCCIISKVTELLTALNVIFNAESKTGISFLPSDLVFWKIAYENFDRFFGLPIEIWDNIKMLQHLN